MISRLPPHVQTSRPDSLIPTIISSSVATPFCRLVAIIVSDCEDEVMCQISPVIGIETRLVEYTACGRRHVRHGFLCVDVLGPSGASYSTLDHNSNDLVEVHPAPWPAEDDQRRLADVIQRMQQQVQREIENRGAAQ